jgi:uroporphyrin-III C-methyltransferase/precorrin-2 dehydrogenase/sirohydrochlorin ferrochelatase
LVVGGSDAAAWKAELLAASGAQVEVVAPSSMIGREMVLLMTCGAAAGSLRHVDRDWTEVDFNGAAIVVADVTADNAPALIDRARAAAVPVNVIDKPEFCDFQFGSIVNRSPVVIGISTSGAAPILGQAVRQRIEILLPKSLAIWGRLASELRDVVMARLRPGAQRRRFWENLADRAFTNAPPKAGDAGRLMDAIAAEDRSAGKVTIVGAGQGGAENLTIKAVRALQSADVILYDKAVSAEVLELARREARRQCVSQFDRSNGLSDSVQFEMMRLARLGKSVVRLKAGLQMAVDYVSEDAATLTESSAEVSRRPSGAAKAFSGPVDAGSPSGRAASEHLEFLI